MKLAVQNRMKLILFSILVWLGRDVVSRRADTKMIGGEPREDMINFPFLGSLQVAYEALDFKFHRNRDEHLCSLILVSETTAISAGHCLVRDPCLLPLELISLYDDPLFAYWGVPGREGMHELDEPLRIRQIDDLVLHPKADYRNRSIWSRSEFDIGALVFDIPLRPWEGPYVRMADMFEQESDAKRVYDRAVVTGRLECDVMGWGAINDSREGDGPFLYPFIVFNIETSLVDNIMCCDHINKVLNATIPCNIRARTRETALKCHLMAPNSLAGFGDSGSPVVCYDRAEPRVMGMHVAQLVKPTMCTPGPGNFTNNTFHCEDRILGVYMTRQTIISWMVENAPKFEWLMSGQERISPGIVVTVGWLVAIKRRN